MTKEISKAMIALFTAICLILSSGVAIAENEDSIINEEIALTLTPYEQEAINILKTLGIIPKNYDTLYEMTQSLPRDEMMVIAMNILGIPSSFGENTSDDNNSDFFAITDYYDRKEIQKRDYYAEYFIEESEGIRVIEEDEYLLEKNVTQDGIFDDVDSSHWAYNAVTVAAKMGFVSQNVPSFNPSDNATLEQAAKVLVSISGYQDYAKRTGGYSAGYLNIARGQGMFKNLTVDSGLTRLAFVKLVYNTLISNPMEQISFGSIEEYSQSRDKTVMEKYMNIKREQGIIEANRETAINGPVGTGKDLVRISGEEYHVGESDAHAYLGRDVDYYYWVGSERDFNTLIAISDLNRNDVLFVEPDEFLSANNIQSEGRGSVKYETDDVNREINITISASAKYIYNHRFKSIVYDNDFKNSRICFVDNDLDGEYDVVFINNYEIYWVDYVLSYEESISDKITGEVYSFSKNDYEVIIKRAGGIIDIEGIKNNDVLNVSRSNVGDGKDVLYIEVTENSFTGILTEKGDELMMFSDGTVCKIDKHYLLETDFTIGKEYTLYKNIFDKVVGVASGGKDGNIYGFFLRASLDSKGLEDQLMLEFVGPTTKEPVRYYAAKKIKHNESIITFEELYNDVLTERQLIKYTLNEAGEVNHILTAVDNRGNYYDIDKFSLDYQVVGGAYNNYNHRYAEQYTATGNTIVYIIPFESTQLDYSKYRVTTRASLNTNTDKYQNYDIYDANPSLDIGVLVIKEYSASGGSRITISGTAVVTRVIRAIVEEDMGYRIEFIDRASHSIKSVFVSSETMEYDTSWGYEKSVTELEFGDVLAYEADHEGNLLNYAVLCDADSALSGTTFYKNSDVRSVTSTAEVFVHKAAYLTLTPVKKRTGSSVILDGKGDNLTPKTVAFNIGSNAVTIVDTKNKRVYKGSVMDIREGENIFLYAAWQAPRHIVVYKTEVL